MKNKLTALFLCILFVTAAVAAVELVKLSENPTKAKSIIRVAYDSGIEKPDLYQEKITQIIQHEGRLSKKTASLYSEYVITAARVNGINASLLLAVISVESRFNATSENKGALGLMQVVATAHGITNSKKLYNPEYNIQIGSGILKYYITKAGEINGGLAMYNGSYGISNVYYKKVLLQKQYYDKILYT